MNADHGRRAPLVAIARAALGIGCSSAAQAGQAAFDHRHDATEGALASSGISDGYDADFERRLKGSDWPLAPSARHAEMPGATPQAQSDIRTGRFRPTHVDDESALDETR